MTQDETKKESAARKLYAAACLAEIYFAHVLGDRMSTDDRETWDALRIAIDAYEVANEAPETEGKS